MISLLFWVQNLERSELERIAREKGEDWAVAAMVHGSIGYHTPSSARVRIRNLLKGERIYGCERTYACFNGDGLEEIAYDFRQFQYVEERDPEKVKRLIEVVRQVAKLDHMGQETFSLMYPTMGL
jgi:hypothetical protein